jgi:diacylglycerol kinase (ATP)
MENTLGSRFRYFLFVLKCLVKFRATNLRLGMNGTSFEGPVLLLEVCLGKFAGAGMRFAPTAAADDGLFDVLLVKDMSITQLLGSLFYLYNGDINKHWAVNSWQCRSISIAAQFAQKLHCDGELVGHLPVEIEIMPQALRVLGAEKLTA